MRESDAARINGEAVTKMQRMVRDGETFRLPSALSAFIAMEGWKAVEHINPETGAPAVASFPDLAAWIEASPARGGLGSRLVKVAEMIGRPLDGDSAAACVLKLVESLPLPELIALAPSLEAMARANASSATGGEVRGWNAVTDGITRKLKRGAGNPTGANQYGKGGTLDRIQDSSPAPPTAPTGTSRSAGLRRLRKYAMDPEACAAKGIDPETAKEAYGQAVREETSVSRALVLAGLRDARPRSIWVGAVDGMADRIIAALGQDKAAELVIALTSRLTPSPDQ